MTSKNEMISVPKRRRSAIIWKCLWSIDSKDDEYIKKMAKDYIPINLTEAIIDYKPIGGENNKNTVVLISRPCRKCWSNC